MEDILRKAKHFGLGVLDFTREKVESLVGEMVKRGEVSEQESPEVVAQIMEKAQAEKEAFTEKLRGMVESLIAKMNLAKAADLEALEKRVTELENKMQGR
ncbi:MAG: polyhydroxyalkanoate synthesis regulator [Deltaproteobacteria bacterium]|nr:polyhydroxyalkanoate synthesis regulator [Deltaproteobacteria bacterium]